MRNREAALRRILSEAGYASQTGSFQRPSVACRQAADSLTWSEIERVYRQLGGVGENCPLRPGSWDIELAEVAVELDEEQHFNLCRAMTLRSTLYEGGRFPVAEYVSFCTIYREECHRKASNRGYWESASTIRQFGPAGEPGNLLPPGSPRWKQRAFYDLLKDLAPVLVGTPVARIAIWDRLDLDGTQVLVKDVLDQNQHHHAAAPSIIDLIERRSGVSLTPHKGDRGPRARR